MNNEFTKKNKLSTKPGFTLIETLIAIAILVLAILGPLTIASNSLNTAYYARDQVTAFYLAQEGVEYMRELRDNNSISATVANGGEWDSGLTACLDVFCGLDPDPSQSDNLFICASLGSCPVQYDPLTGLYRQREDAKFVPTNFKRTIMVKKVSKGGDQTQEDQVIVVVSWTTGNLKSPNNFKITENLFNWQQGIGQPVEPPEGGGGDINPGGGGNVDPGGGNIDPSGGGGSTVLD